MRLPPSSSAYLVFVRYGRYVTRRLRQAGHADLAESTERATAIVRDTGRAWEDADDPIQAAFADRDAADDELDDATEEFRVILAGRGKEAVKQAPYTLIFPRASATTPPRPWTTTPGATRSSSRAWSSPSRPPTPPAKPS